MRRIRFPRARWRDEDFTVRPASSEKAPAEAIQNTADAKLELRGSLVRKFLDAGSFITSDDVLRPRDRGFLASVLAPGTRAISIKVDAESGVSGLIWPGDYVDVMLTHDMDKADLAHRTASETVLQNVRIIAIDQEIVQGGADKAAAEKETHTVSLQLEPEQVAKITVAQHLGKLSLAMRAAVEQRGEEGESGTTFSGDVSPEIARQSKTVIVYSGDKVKEYSVQKPEGVDGAAYPSHSGSPTCSGRASPAI